MVRVLLGSPPGQRQPARDPTTALEPRRRLGYPAARAARARLSHLDRRGRARMVDVSAKAVTAARGASRAARCGCDRRRCGDHRRGAAEGRRAGGRAARGHHGRQAHRRADPALSSAAAVRRRGRRSSPTPRTRCVSIESRGAASTARTGVEMEALTAVAVAALTLYDMCKAIDRDMTIGAVRLMREAGRPERRVPSHRRALTCAAVTLKPGREAPVRGGHPWIFSGAIASGLDGAEPGEPVRVVAAGGGFVAVGLRQSAHDDRGARADARRRGDRARSSSRRRDRRGAGIASRRRARRDRCLPSRERGG